MPFVRKPSEDDGLDFLDRTGKEKNKPVFKVKNLSFAKDIDKGKNLDLESLKIKAPDSDPIKAPDLLSPPN